MARLKDYTKSELEVLPLNIVRSIDIANAEEEAIVQDVINRRISTEPGELKPLIFSASDTDNMTIEKERELQQRQDKHREEQLARMNPVKSEDPEEGEVDSEEEEVDPEIISTESEIVKAKRGRPKKQEVVSV